jgi:hypothetical protein
MKTLNPNRRTVFILGILVVLVFVSGSLAKLSRAHTQTINVTVVNNSNRTFSGLYFSPVESNSWSADQLNGAQITPSHSFTANNVPCDQASIKVIGEDGDGCFSEQVVNCSGDASWTITSDTARNCGN